MTGLLGLFCRSQGLLVLRRCSLPTTEPLYSYLAAFSRSSNGIILLRWVVGVEAEMSADDVERSKKAREVETAVVCKITDGSIQIVSIIETRIIITTRRAW